MEMGEGFVGEVANEQELEQNSNVGLGRKGGRHRSEREGEVYGHTTRNVTDLG